MMNQSQNSGTVDNYILNEVTNFAVVLINFNTIILNNIFSFFVYKNIAAMIPPEPDTVISPPFILGGQEMYTVLSIGGFKYRI